MADELTVRDGNPTVLVLGPPDPGIADVLEVGGGGEMLFYQLGRDRRVQDSVRPHSTPCEARVWARVAPGGRGGLHILQSS